MQLILQTSHPRHESSKDRDFRVDGSLLHPCEKEHSLPFRQQSLLLVLAIVRGVKEADAFFKNGTSLSSSRKQRDSTEAQSHVHGLPFVEERCFAHGRYVRIDLRYIFKVVIIQPRKSGWPLKTLLIAAGPRARS